MTGREKYLKEWKKNNPDYHKNYWQSQKKDRLCVICGAIFKSVNPAQTCSCACRGKLKTQNHAQTLVCRVCGEVFKRGNSHIKNGRNKTCSVECRWVWHSRLMSGENHPMWKDAKKVFKCVVCGEDFKRYKKDDSRNKTCSTECKYIYIAKVLSGENHYLWAGGTRAYRGMDWRRIRQDILKRDNYTCQDCGKTTEEETVENNKELSVHHIIPFRFFGEEHEKANRPENLITLCNSCHRKAENYAGKGVAQ